MAPIRDRTWLLTPKSETRLSQCHSWVPAMALGRKEGSVRVWVPT